MTFRSSDCQSAAPPNRFRLFADCNRKTGKGCSAEYKRLLKEDKALEPAENSVEYVSRCRHRPESVRDRKTTLSYVDVVRYEVLLPKGASSPAAPTRGHGDWLIDEVRLSDDGKVLHEIAFGSGARWTIECTMIRHATTAPAVSD